MAREKFEAISRQYDQAESEFKAIVQEFWDDIERSGMKSFKRDDGTNFIRTATVYSNVTDREALIEALEKAELTEFIFRDVRKKALNEYVKQVLEEEKEMLPGLSFNVTRSIRRA